MHKLKRKLSLVRKKDLSTDEVESEDDWQEDEMKVRKGTCNFLLHYIGCLQVMDSKGIEVCEEATKKVVEKTEKPYKTVIFQVRGEHLKTVNEENGELLMDQLVERVSFCSPNRQDVKGFAYICRDSATRSWVCHVFISLKEKGERVSYAVGYAFNICMELRMKRETDKDSGFVRSQSFRTTSMSDRRTDPQSALVAGEAIPKRKIGRLQSIDRPRPPEQLKRQSSLISLNNIDELQAAEENSSKAVRSRVFKRQMSMKVEELSSILDRLNAKDSQKNRWRNRSGSGVVNDSQPFGGAFNDGHLDNNTTNTDNKTTKTDNTITAKPIVQSNPWMKKPPLNRITPAQRKIEADEWLLAVAKKASLLRKETGRAPFKGDTFKRVQMAQAHSHSMDVLKDRVRKEEVVKTPSLDKTDHKSSVHKPADKPEDPFDTGWVQTLANKGKNPFKTRSATIIS